MTSTPSDPVAAVREAIALGPTPGPWSLGIKDGPWVDAAYVRAPSWGVVARVGLSYSLPHWDGPQRANAAFIAACNPAAIAALLAQLPAAQQQHHRDSAELRSLCEARDAARRERDLCRVEIAGLTASVGNLCRLVDELRPGHDRYQWLRDRPLETVAQGGVFAGKTPDNVVLNGSDLDAAIDAALAEQQEGEPA